MTLSAPVSQSVSVQYATADGTATTAAGDYAPTSGTLTFVPGVTSLPVSVSVAGDRLFEPNEAFFVNLSNPSTNATVADGQGQGTIQNDDPLPTISIADASQPEGNGGTTGLAFAISLSNPSTLPVSFRYDTADGTATTADRDYVAAGAQVTIAPGQTAATVTVDAIGDVRTEPDEAFALVLTVPSGGTLGRDRAVGTIRDDDVTSPGGAVQLGAATYAVPEGVGTATVTVTRTSGSGTVTVGYATSDGTARAGEDYTTTLGSLTFNPGETSRTFGVPVAPDDLPEADETFLVLLTSVGGASIGNPASATVTLRDDDPQPALTIDDIGLVEGSGGGTTSAVFTVTLSRTSGQVVSVQFATADGFALAGQDYAATTGSLVFAPGETTRSIAVPVVADRAFERDETFTVGLSAATNASIARGQATGVIVDDDAGRCQPRPPVRVEVVRRNADDLLVTLSAGTSATTPTNQLIALRLDKATNARVGDLLEAGAMQLGRAIQLQPNTQQVRFVVQQPTPGSPTIVELTVTDDCGSWPTFVGVGTGR